MSLADYASETNKSAFVSAIFRKPISILSRPRPLSSSGPASHVTKTQYFELYNLYFELYNGRLHQIAWQGHDNINKAQFYAPSMYKAWIYIHLEGKTQRDDCTS